MFYYEVDKNILKGYFFLKANAQVLPKFQTSMDALE